MGYTRFSGPVYGSKSMLCAFGPQTVTSGATTALAWTNSIRVVPPYEDWYVTECMLTCSTNTSNAAAIYVKSEGGSTTIPPRIGTTPGNGSTQAQTIFSLNSGTSTNWSTNATATASPGEVEGIWVPAGSSVRLVSSGNSGASNMHVQLMGFIRYVDSTRAV